MAIVVGTHAHMLVEPDGPACPANAVRMRRYHAWLNLAAAALLVYGHS